MKKLVQQFLLNPIEISTDFALGLLPEEALMTNRSLSRQGLLLKRSWLGTECEFAKNVGIQFPTFSRFHRSFRR